MVGDYVTYLDCVSCGSMETCVAEIKLNKIGMHNHSHIKKGVIDRITETHFETVGSLDLNPNESIIQIRRDIVVEEKIPNNIISLEF